jgi:hypothetical protein
MGGGIQPKILHDSPVETTSVEIFSAVQGLFTVPPNRAEACDWK